MAGRVIVRDFGVVIVDEAVAGAQEVMEALDRAAEAIRGGAPNRLAYVMAHLTIDVDETRARALTRHAVEATPDGLRIAMVHERNPRMTAIADLVVEELQRLGATAGAFASLPDAEAWLRGEAE